MKKSTLGLIAVIAVGTISCNMVFCKTNYPAASAMSVTASAAEANGNLIVQITGMPELSGVTVTVTGNGKTYTAVTNDKGQAVFSKLPVHDSAGNSITYTIQETIPEGYLAASSMTTTLSTGSTVIASIPNTETYGETVSVEYAIANISRKKVSCTVHFSDFGTAYLLLDKDENVVKEIPLVPENTLLLNDLNAGETYILREVHTPDGYAVTPNIQFVAKEDLQLTVSHTQQAYSIYTLFDKDGRIDLAHGDYIEGAAINLPQKGVTEPYYLLRIETGDPDSSIGTALMEMYIVLHEDGTYEPYAEQEILYGDVNLDGRVDLSDAILLNKYCSGAVKLSKEQIAAGNCDSDSQTDMNDSIALLRFLVHLETKLPVSEQGEERV